jgi:hypothetical protein
LRPTTLYIWNTKAALARNSKVFEHLSAVLQRAFAPDVEVMMMPPYESLLVVVNDSAPQTYGFYYHHWQIIQQILWEHGIFASESRRLTISELCPALDKTVISSNSNFPFEEGYEPIRI